jgi:hypothetical protein
MADSSVGVVEAVADGVVVPSRIRLFEKRLAVEEPPDWLSLASLVFGVLGLMFRVSVVLLVVVGL